MDDDFTFICVKTSDRKAMVAIIDFLASLPVEPGSSHIFLGDTAETLCEVIKQDAKQS